MGVHQPFLPITWRHLRFGCAVREAPGFGLCTSSRPDPPAPLLCGRWTAQPWARRARAAWPCLSWCCCFLLETTGRRRKQFLYCFWPLVSPAPQIFNQQTFLPEWVFPVNSIPAEAGPINTSALCHWVYLAGKWVLPCKQEAPWSYYLQMRLKSHVFIFMGFENSLKRQGRRWGSPHSQSVRAGPTELRGLTFPSLWERVVTDSGTMRTWGRNRGTGVWFQQNNPM